MRSPIRYSVALLALTTTVGAANADSLFPVKKSASVTRGTGSSASLFSDNRAYAVGDPLTVVVAENTTATASADNKLSKSEAMGPTLSGGAAAIQHLFNALNFSLGSSSTGSGSGVTDRSGSLTTTLSVLVKEVLPNGSLRIEGSRLVGINKETQKVTFTGIVRPEDIAVDNSIQSSLVASVEVRYDGKGIVSDTVKMGFFTRILHTLF